MSFRDPILAGKVSSLDEEVSELCKFMQNHLKASTESDTTALKSLVVELRLFSGTLHSLRALIKDLEDSESDGSDNHVASPAPNATRQKIEWLILDGIDSLISQIQCWYKDAKPHILMDSKGVLSNYRSRLGFVLGSETIQDVSRNLSIFGKEPPPTFEPNNTITALGLEDESAFVPKPAPENQESFSAEEISAWLSVINAAEEDREPAEYSEEQALVEARRATKPQYQMGAARWHKYAELNWAKLRPQVCSLFRLPKSNNLVQWTLEYARERYPRLFGRTALSPKGILNLTDTLCDSSTSSFHIAAAFSLPSLCRDLISMGANVNEQSLLGSPLFCSLIGPKVLATQAEPETWNQLIELAEDPVRRIDTIALLLDKGADCRYKFHWKGAEDVSLAGVAFWIALSCKHPAIFTRIMTGGATLDLSFAHLMAHQVLLNTGMDCKPRFALLLTSVYDATWNSSTVSEEDVIETIRTGVQEIMIPYRLEFTFLHNNKRIASIKDEVFADFLQQAILENNVFLLRRLSLDPRFEPNYPIGRDGDEGTILHMAVEGGHQELIDLLMTSGSSLEARDGSDRTPLMLVESVDTLAFLVYRYNATTLHHDNQGRTIWHFAAASNDVKLIDWLCKNDPNKQTCLFMTNSAILTPLQDAMVWVLRLLAAADSNPRMPAEPVAARRLLKEYHELPVRGKFELCAAAVEWGALDVLQDLLRLEKGFVPKSEDRLGRQLIHFLNSAASEELVSFVMELCKDVPWHTRNESSPAETFLTNTKLARSHTSTTGIMQERKTLTAHPSCTHALCPKIYRKVLTPEIVEFVDSKGCPLWERFTTNVISKLDKRPEASQPASDLFTKNMLTAVKCLAEHGVMDAYERETKKSALACFWKVGGHDWGRRGWKLLFVPTILNVSRNDATRKFLDGPEALLVFQAAALYNSTETVQMLLERGIPLFRPSPTTKELTAEAYLWDPRIPDTIVETIIRSAPTGFLNLRQEHIFLQFLRDTNSELDLNRLGLLLRGGMDPNFVADYSISQCPMLVRAMAIGNKRLADFLLTNGADPTVGPLGRNGFLGAIKSAHEDLLLRVLTIASRTPNFNWFMYEDIPGKPTMNAIQMATTLNNPRCLSLLLQMEEYQLAPDTISPRNPRPPMHIAVEIGSVECLKILYEMGCNPKLENPEGVTALELATCLGFEPGIAYLRDEKSLQARPIPHNRRPLHESAKASREYASDHFMSGNGSETGVDPSFVDDNEDGEDEDDDDDEEAGDGDADEVMGENEMEDEGEDERLAGRIALGFARRRNIEHPKHGHEFDLPPNPSLERARERRRREIGNCVFKALENIDKGVSPMDTALRSLTDRYYIGEIRTAALPCNGCTFFSYSYIMTDPSFCEFLIEHSLIIEIMGCQTHYAFGFNAIVSMFLSITGLLVIGNPDCQQRLANYTWYLLDHYLAQGILWFHLPCTPVMAVCHFIGFLGHKDLGIYRWLLDTILTHVERYADNYCTLLSKTGVYLDVVKTATGERDRKQVLFSLVANARYYGSSLTLYTGSQGATPLHILMENSVENMDDSHDSLLWAMWDRLVQFGALVDARTDDGLTPLHIAVRKNNMRAVQFILKTGAGNINLRDVKGYTPLMHALERGNQHIINLLLYYGADSRILTELAPPVFDDNLSPETISRIDWTGYDANQIVAAPPVVMKWLCQNSATCTYMVTEMAWDAVTDPSVSHSVLACAITTSPRNPNILKFILRRIPFKDRINVVNPRSEPRSDIGRNWGVSNPAGAAIVVDSLPHLRLLLDAGLMIEQRMSSFGTPLMFACILGRFSLVKELVRRGARLAFTVCGPLGLWIYDAIRCAAPYPEITHWLLVGRYQSRKRLTNHSFAPRTQCIRPWSGKTCAAYLLHGMEGQFGKLDDESSRDFLKRLHNVRSQIVRGEPIPVDHTVNILE